MKQEEVKHAFLATKEYERKRALEAFFEKESWTYELDDFNWFMRAFLLLKAWICLKLKRTDGSYLNNEVCVLAYDERSYWDSESWDAVWVSKCFFNDWRVCLAVDGT